MAEDNPQDPCPHSGKGTERRDTGHVETGGQELKGPSPEAHCMRSGWQSQGVPQGAGEGSSPPPGAQTARPCTPHTSPAGPAMGSPPRGCVGTLRPRGMRPRFQIQRAAHRVTLGRSSHPAPPRPQVTCQLGQTGREQKRTRPSPCLEAAGPLRRVRQVPRASGPCFRPGARGQVRAGDLTSP